MNSKPQYYDYLNTPMGLIAIAATDVGVTAVGFVESKEHSVKMNGHTDTAKVQLKEYFAGNRTCFDVSLAAQGTEFQQQVWKVLLTIPYGTTASYGDIANELNNPKAVRAVGAANGRNPIAIIVPCHRIIGANGTLTGYAGGLERKADLLKLENPQKEIWN